MQYAETFHTTHQDFPLAAPLLLSNSLAPTCKLCFPIHPSGQHIASCRARCRRWCSFLHLAELVRRLFSRHCRAIVL